MAQMRVSAERLLDAPAEVVYRCLADYREHHPKILPPAFSDFRVEAGGVGAGTIASFKVKAGGRTRSFRVLVAEPEPGRVLTETDGAAGTTTTFTVTPEGDQSRVRFDSTWPGAGGIAGVLELLVAPRVFAKLYADELARLERYARDQMSGLPE